MQRTYPPYLIDDDRDRIDYRTVCAWLASTYWSPGISVGDVTRAAKGSAVVVGAYRGDDQCGYLRVVSDSATFAWIADVFVRADCRHQGLAAAMVRFALAHPDLQGLRRWMLATRDAQPLYASIGFHTVADPQSLMVLRPGRRKPHTVQENL